MSEVRRHMRSCEMMHEFITDDRIAELFPDPKAAAYVIGIRNRFQARYEEWSRDQSQKEVKVDTLESSIVPTLE